MAIQDVMAVAGGAGLAAVPPLSGQGYSASQGLDLNPDFGTGINARKSPNPGMGSEIAMRVDIFTSFAASAGAPIIGFHAILSEVATPTAVTGTDNFVTIGSNLGPFSTDGARLFPGFLVADLAANSHFYIRFNPWTKSMGRDVLLNVLPGNSLRYLALAITVPNWDAAGSPTATGIAVWSLVNMGDILEDPQEHIYPAGRTVI